MPADRSAGDASRREKHLTSEQRRRNTFNSYIDQAREVLPGHAEGFRHTSKALVVRDCIEYIILLEQILADYGIDNPYFRPEKYIRPDAKAYQKPSPFLNQNVMRCSCCLHVLPHTRLVAPSQVLYNASTSHQ